MVSAVLLKQGSSGRTGPNDEVQMLVPNSGTCLAAASESKEGKKGSGGLDKFDMGSILESHS